VKRPTRRGVVTFAAGWLTGQLVRVRLRWHRAEPGYKEAPGHRTVKVTIRAVKPEEGTSDEV